jgi:hypothetical protein
MEETILSLNNTKYLKLCLLEHDLIFIEVENLEIRKYMKLFHVEFYTCDKGR